jgi:site-specific recombinase XerD
LDLACIETVHVAAYIKSMEEEAFSVPSIKQHLAALKHLFDHLVTGGIIKLNPAAAVRGPRYSAAEGKTPILTGDEPRRLLASIKTDTLIGLRDRALIGLLLYTAARVNAAVSLKVGDYYSQGATWFLRLREKGGKRHVMPCNHHLQEYLSAYIDAAGIAKDAKWPLFRTLRRGVETISRAPLTQSNVYELIQRRKKSAGIKTEVGCHSMRGTAITNLLENGASVEEAQSLANHASIRTTKLYDRRDQSVRRDLVERIRF